MKVVRVLIYEYDTLERALDDMAHWTAPANGFTNFGAFKKVTSTIIENADEHYVTLGDDGWSMQHSLLCRPALLDCPYHHEAKAWAEEGLFKEMTEGKYHMIQNPQGSFVYVLEEH